LANTKIKWVKNTFINWFIKKYQVNMQEAENVDPTSYPNFNAFFTRALQPGARPIANEGICCPVDGAISQIGSIL